MYSMKLMIVLCLAIVVAGGKGIKKKILRNIQNQVGELAEAVANLTRKLEDNVKLSSDTSNKVSDIADVLENLKPKDDKYDKPRSCTDLLVLGQPSGTYTIYPEDIGPIEVYCGQTTDNGGWIVFQRRKDGSENFLRNWNDYKVGFGDISGEFWLGLEKIHLLTASGNHELRIDLEDFENNKRYATYSSFGVGSESGNYVLTATGYSGDAGDAMTYHNGRPFSTIDKDNDIWPKDCADTFKGGWWYGKMPPL